MILREDKRVICAIRTCYGGGKIWFLHAFLNLLYSVDVNNGESCCYELPVGMQNRMYYFSNISYVDGRIWLIPGYAREIVIFDENTEIFSSFVPNDMNEANREKEYIYAIDSMNMDRCLVLFPYTDTIIRKFDVETYHQENIDIKNYIGGEWYWGNLVIKISNSECFFTRMRCSDFLYINLKTGEVNIFETELKDATEISAVILNKRLYVYTNTVDDPFVYEIDIHSGKIVNKCFLKEVDTNFVKLGSINDRYLALEYSEKQKTILLSPELEILNEENNENISEEDFAYRFYMGIPWRLWLQSEGETSYCLPNTGNQIGIYKNANIYSERVFQISIDEEKYDKALTNYKKYILRNNYFVSEGKDGEGLRDYLNDIINFYK